jgi:hypothetical protein
MLEAFHAARKKRSELPDASATDLERAGAFPDATRGSHFAVRARLLRVSQALGFAVAVFLRGLTAVSPIG